MGKYSIKSKEGAILKILEGMTVSDAKRLLNTIAATLDLNAIVSKPS